MTASEAVGMSVTTTNSLSQDYTNLVQYMYVDDHILQNLYLLILLGSNHLLYWIVNEIWIVFIDMHYIKLIIILNLFKIV